MKGKVLLLSMILLLALPSFAQKHTDKDKEAKRKELMEIKLNYLADEMDLQGEKKKQFFEVYSQMESERRKIFKKIKAAEKRISGTKDASENDYEKASNEITEAKNEMAQIEAKYDEKFATFLTKKQIYTMKAAESKFMEKVRGCRDKRKALKKQ